MLKQEGYQGREKRYLGSQGVRAIEGSRDEVFIVQRSNVTASRDASSSSAEQVSLCQFKQCTLL